MAIYSSKKKEPKNKKLGTEKKPKSKKSLNASTLEKKYLAGDKLFLYEERYLEKKLILQCDTLFSAIIRARDCAGKKVLCNSYQSCPGCFKTITYHTSHCCHWIDRGYYSHRWDVRNAFACCPPCNNPDFYSMEHKKALEAKIDKLYKGASDEMRNSRNKRKPSVGELMIIRDNLKASHGQIPEGRR